MELKEAIEFENIIGLFWNKKTGQFLGIAYKDKGDWVFKSWEEDEWVPLHKILGDEDQRKNFAMGIDYMQTEHIELMHDFKNSICEVHINCRVIRVC